MSPLFSYSIQTNFLLYFILIFALSLIVPNFMNATVLISLLLATFYQFPLLCSGFSVWCSISSMLTGIILSFPLNFVYFCFLQIPCSNARQNMNDQLSLGHCFSSIAAQIMLFDLLLLVFATWDVRGRREENTTKQRLVM